MTSWQRTDSCLFLTVARLGSANDHIVEAAAARSQAADQLQIVAGQLHTAQLAYVLDWPTTRTQFEQASSQFEAVLQNLRESADDPVAQTLIHKIATGYQTFLATDQLIWDALQSGAPVLARNLTLGAEVRTPTRRGGVRLLGADSRATKLRRR